MRKVFIIGLPVQLRRRIETSLENREISPATVLADTDKTGRLKLLPDPSLVASRLRDYCESVEDGYDHAEVYVLPYTPIPEDVSDELDALEDMGAKIIFFEMEEDGWPYLHAPRPRMDQEFLDGAFSALLTGIALDEESVEQLPSEYIRSTCQAVPSLVIVGNAIDSCDAIAVSRRAWVMQAIDAFADLIAKKGNIEGSLDAFFEARALNHAKSGGISVKLEVMVGGKEVRTQTSNEHLKKGDHTTPQAAVRVYYQLLLYEGEYYVFLLYVGPHPDRALSYVHHLV